MVSDASKFRICTWLERRVIEYIALILTMREILKKSLLKENLHYEDSSSSGPFSFFVLHVDDIKTGGGYMT